MYELNERVKEKIKNFTEELNCLLEEYGYEDYLKVLEDIAERFKDELGDKYFIDHLNIKQIYYSDDSYLLDLVKNCDYLYSVYKSISTWDGGFYTKINVLKNTFHSVNVCDFENIVGEFINYLEKIELKKVKPKTSEELQSLIVKYEGHYDLINTSQITDMTMLFMGQHKIEDFSGIETWDTSNVVNMNSMFMSAYHFNQDISNWNVSKVKNMRSMFNQTAFNQNISNWDISKVQNMCSMFLYTPFNQNLSNWEIQATFYNDIAVMFGNSKYSYDLPKSKKVNFLEEAFFRDTEDYQKYLKRKQKEKK